MFTPFYFIFFGRKRSRFRCQKNYSKYVLKRRVDFNPGDFFISSVNLNTNLMKAKSV